MCTCAFAFASLLAIWWHLGKKKNDRGQIWLALSVLCWSFSGLVDIIFTNIRLDELAASQISPSTKFLQDGLRSIFSLLNSLFILLALPYFKYIPISIASFIKSKYWHWIIGLPFLFSLLPTISFIIQKNTNSLVSELDVYYGLLTLFFLGWVLWESFIKRRLTILAYLSLLCIGITLVSQIMKLSNLNVDTILLSAIFKTSLIMIFFALALSWVKDLSESLDITGLDIFLDFQSVKNKNVKNSLIINGINNKSILVKLTRGQYHLLHVFAQKKKWDQDKGWLNIKPKSEKRNGDKYDIKDHNEIKRLTHGLLDDIYGKSMWTKNSHELPFKEIFFEQSETEDRKIRLSIPASNIKL